MDEILNAMVQRPLIAAYWMDRRCSAGEASRAAAEFYAHLRRTYPRFSEMAVHHSDKTPAALLTGDPGKDAPSFLAEAFRAGTVYRLASGVKASFGPDVYSPVGFRMEAIDAAAEEKAVGASIMLSVHQGVIGSHMPPNNVLVEFPADAPMDAAMLAEVQALMRDVVRFWRPETAFYLTGSFRDAVMGVDEDGEGGVEDYVGWITYVDRYKDVKGLDVYATEREGEGAFIQLVETPGQDFKAEVRRAIKARDKLVAAGILKVK